MVNIDGSAIGAPCAAGFRGIFWYYRGSPFGSFYSSIGSGFAFEAKLAVTIFVIDKAFTVGWQQLWLENCST